MKKKILKYFPLLFVSLLMLCFASCSKDDNNNDSDPNSIVPTTTGAITHTGVNFNQKGLIVQSATLVATESLIKSTTRGIAMRLSFNDNVEVIVIADNFPSNQKITIDNAYYTFLKYGTKVRFNLIENLKIKATETFSIPMGSLTSLFNEEVNTLALNFKNKYEYIGKIELPETPEVGVPEIVEPTEPIEQPIAPNNYIKTLKNTLWISSSPSLFEGQKVGENAFRWDLPDKYLILFSDDKFTFGEVQEGGTFITQILFNIKYSSNVNFSVISGGNASFSYEIKTITPSRVELNYYKFRLNNTEYNKNYDIVLTKYTSLAN